ncbi:helix-turn-helix protein [Providencia alcalifaciens]|uniref:Helix-turn-helix protein n=1 Tax=Providencia alcalifaciens TaxID=126385 RepID=A0A4R3NS92_9GAMM|nr:MULTISPECIES: helix-turn-helix domain-containing protein [Providencia]TCT38333.1 helix-turn-helix protein [Providencia alcalifaciens]
MEDDSLFTVKEYAALLKLSESTVYRNPAKYHMFRVGRSWRASKESLKRFEQDQFHDGVSLSIREKRKKSTLSNGSFNMFMSQIEAERELEQRLAKRKRRLTN